MNTVKNVVLAATCVLASVAFVACGDSSTDASNDNSALNGTSSNSGVVVDDKSSDSKSSDSAKKLNCGPVPAEEEVVTTYKVTYDSIVDARDGRVYKTVTYWSFSPESGPFACEEFSQTWMAENLKYADSAATPSLKGSSWCYDNDDAKCESGGRLYTWAATVDSVKLASDKDNPLNCGFGSQCFLLSSKSEVQGICPEGWHVPTDSDWEGVRVHPEETYTIIGKALKSKTGWAYETSNGTDDYGFTALPVGMWNGNSSEFLEEGKKAYFWTAVEYLNYGANVKILKHNSLDLHSDVVDKNMGLSVRCVKNGMTYRTVDEPSEVFFE